MMTHIYIALVDTPGIFASLIRIKEKISYVHVVLGLDESLSEAYSFGRRNPRVPIIAGFVRENPEVILAAFPTARYKIIRVPCTAEQKKRLQMDMRRYYAERYQYFYSVLGLIRLLAGIPCRQEKHFTCSSFIAKELSEAGVIDLGKHYSLATPRDFYDAQLGETIYEGTLEGYIGHALARPLKERAI